MIWIRLAVNCILSVGFAGLAADIFVVVLSKLHKSLNPYLMLALQKAALLLYWLPIPFLAVCMSRIEYADGNIAYVGDFVCSTFPFMTRLFLLLGIVWSAGAILSALRGVRKKLCWIKYCGEMCL